ncbi:hypothetical protein D3C73_17950 [compost metagenome]
MIEDILKDLRQKADDRFADFEIEDVGSISEIYEDSYLEKPVWLGGDSKYVCLFIDLDKSSKMSFKKHPSTMAKIYDYFTQTLIDVLSQESIHAEYVDIKGDGAFGIFEGEDAAFRALSAALTFGTFFKKYIRPKFQTASDTINFKATIHVDKILVKRIGTRGPRNNNEVWAGRLINKAAKLGLATRHIYSQDPAFDSSKLSLLIISQEILDIFQTKREYAVMHCGHDIHGGVAPYASPLWVGFDSTDIEDLDEDAVYYAPGLWCDICQDKVNEGLLS